MKALRTHLILTAIALMLTSCYASRSTYAQGGYYDNYGDGQEYYNEYDNYNNGGVSFNVFYDELRPYGRWINHNAYGRIWIPNVGGNFHPYATNGYWVMTDYGNTWVSDYSWGWAPFHYGRWYYDDYLGWAWIPGYEWAPAWVSWRSGGGYYGWAPMGPGFHINININLPARYWTFLPNKYMYYRNMHRHYNRYSPAIYNRTTIINNTYIYNDNRYYSGPTASDYRRETGRTTTVRRLESTTNRSGRASSRVSNSAVQVYRPDATTGRSTTTREAVTPRSTNRTGTVGTQSTTRSNSGVSTPQRSTGTTRQSTTAPANRSTSSTNRNATVRGESTTTTRSTPTTTRSTPTTTRSTPTTARSTTTTTRNSNATPQRSSTSSTRNSSATQQRSSSGSNRSSSVSSQSTTRSSSSATRSSSGSSTRESSSSGRSSGRR